MSVRSPAISQRSGERTVTGTPARPGSVVTLGCGSGPARSSGLQVGPEVRPGTGPNQPGPGAVGSARSTNARQAAGDTANSRPVCDQCPANDGKHRKTRRVDPTRRATPLSSPGRTGLRWAPMASYPGRSRRDGLLTRGPRAAHATFPRAHPHAR